MIRFTVLGSGSGGNATLVESASTRILIDAGFSTREIERRLAAHGCSLSTIDAVLVTHEHEDHVRALPVLTRRYGDLPIYCNPRTADELRPRMPQAQHWRLFETGASWAVGDLSIQSFPVLHDAVDPVAFVVRSASRSLGIVTDLGHVTHLVRHHLRGVDALLLEANYDLQLLHDDTRRPWDIKQRIQGRHGHLSNTDAADLLAELDSDRLEFVVLGHLSQDCNSPDKALQAAQEGIARRGASASAMPIMCCVASQEAGVPPRMLL